MRFLAYFFLVFVTLFVLRQLPLVGGLFQIPLVGFFLAAMVVSALVARGGQVMTNRAHAKRQMRELGEVDTPQRRGKLGRLLLQNGRAREAVDHLRAACDADEETVDWPYRLGVALLESGEAEEATMWLNKAREMDEGFAYGGVLLKLSEAALALGDFEAALEALERYEVFQGPSPEQAFRRGRVLKAMGRREEAKASLESVTQLAARAPKYQRAEARAWAARAFWAKLF